MNNDNEHKTIFIVRNLSGDEKIRQEAYYREKRLHDEATALGHARSEGIAQGRAEGRAEIRKEMAQRMREKGMTEDEIRSILGE